MGDFIKTATALAIVLILAFGGILYSLKPKITKLVSKDGYVKVVFSSKTDKEKMQEISRKLEANHGIIMDYSGSVFTADGELNYLDVQVDGGENFRCSGACSADMDFIFQEFGFELVNSNEETRASFGSL